MGRKALLLGLLLLNVLLLSARDYTVISPNGNLRMVIGVNEKVTYTVEAGDKTLVAPSTIALELEDGTMLGNQPEVLNVRKDHQAETFVAPLYRQSTFESEYNSLVLKMKGNWGIEVRAFNDGVAYRLFTTFKKRLAIKNEVVEFNFEKDVQVTLPYGDLFKDKYVASFEKQYETEPVSHFKNHEGRLSYMPIMVHYDNEEKVLLLESDVENYPGMFINYNTKELGLVGEFPPYPLKHKDTSNGVLRVSERAPYIASVEGNRTYPWRIIAYAANEKEVPINNMVYALASPCRIEDTSWIKPGRSTWDWWNHCSIYNVDFKVGFNNDTYKYYIDFASEYHFDYVLIDDGWYSYHNRNVMDADPALDIPMLCEYAKSKDVRLILWMVGDAFDKQAEEVCAYYSKLGIAGFKLDFFERQDQHLIERTYSMAAVAAKYNMMLNLHGVYVPKGLNRTYPNVVNFEAVFGLEQLKWTDKTKADMAHNDLMIPFMRQVAGPLDYTPGAMLNRKRDMFRSIDHRPMSQGTRAHQVATYIIFDMPVSVLCDSPTNYIRESETTHFINSIPAVFDSTFVHQSEWNKYLVMGRKKGNDFYLGAYNDWDERTVEVDLSFLSEGEYTARIYKDGLNVDRVAEDYKLMEQIVTSADKLTLFMGSGGGFAIIFTKNK
ncbi:MAG: glycoside hydrolase family 97 protein [Bacteroidaceae bacterium]|nr:glycoside hydrolase family 97 protein [Bacteroidaceae bacterium]